MIETIPDLFYAALERDSPVALAHRVDGRFLPISHRELQARVERLALALAARGIRRGDRLAILAENGPEWAVTDYACALALQDDGKAVVAGSVNFIGAMVRLPMLSTWMLNTPSGSSAWCPSSSLRIT